MHLEGLLKQLGLPGPDTEGQDPRELRLEVLRSARDRARAVVLRQLSVANVKYAKRVDTIEQGDRENLAERWRVNWQHRTAALVAAAARWGVTLHQVTESLVRDLRSGDGQDDSAARPDRVLDRLQIAAECGLHNEVTRTIREIDKSYLSTANISQLVAAASWIGRIRAGHVPGLPRDESLAFPPILRVYRLPTDAPSVGPLLDACLNRLQGLEGSDRAEDVAGLVDLVYWFTGDLAAEPVDESGAVHVPACRASIERLRSWCEQTSHRGSDRMRGAAIGVLGVLGSCSADRFGVLTSGWFDGASRSEGRRRLRYALAGAMQVLLPLAQNDISWLDGLEERFAHARDELFLARLPALRGGFSELAPADRRRLLDARLSQYDERGTQILRDDAQVLATGSETDDPTLRLAARRAADLAGRAAVERLLPQLLAGFEPAQTPVVNAPDNNHPPAPAERPALPAGSISLADRWRLVLAVTEVQAPRSCAAASCLDQLYGFGKGEGAGDRLAPRLRCATAWRNRGARTHRGRLGQRSGRTVRRGCVPGSAGRSGRQRACGGG